MQYWRGNSTPTKDRQRPTRITLPLIDQMFAVLVRLRLGLLLNDIADRFSIPVSSFSNMFTTWICLMYEELKLINIFPTRQLVSLNTPKSFKSFPNIRIIIDCTEIFIQRSSSLVNQNLTFSNYKHHNTL